MDRPLPVPVNRSRARIKRYALTAVVLMTVVFGVGALPVAFLYFWMPSINAAEFLGATSGVVAVGKQADLILVNGDPLKDVSNASRRAGVMLRGHWLVEDDLRRMLDTLAQ
jgi:cytosine/adenosine deaminase-related metal-dependent hydrolase